MGRAWSGPAPGNPCLQHSLTLSFSPTEYAENIGDGRSSEFRESEQKRILGLLENF